MLETKRLILRNWQESDAKELFEYAKDPDIGSPCGWQAHKDAEESKEVIRNVLSGPECYAIFQKSDRKLVGCVELSMYGRSVLANEPGECELGYWVGKPYWGLGYMPEAANEVIRRAFEDLSLSKVWCAYYDGNDKSRRVQEKCGFRYQKTNPDTDVPMLHEKRISHISLLTKENWLQLQRIRFHEEIKQELEEKLASAENEPPVSGDIKEKIKQLEAYYGSPEWKKDFADDEAGLLPKDLRRGVLSEDGIYNLLEQYKA